MAIVVPATFRIAINFEELVFALPTDQPSQGLYDMGDDNGFDDVGFG